MRDVMLQVIKNTDKRHFSHPSLSLSAKFSIRNSAPIIPILTEAHKVPVSMLGALFLVLNLCQEITITLSFLIGPKGLSEDKSKYRIIF